MKNNTYQSQRTYCGKEQINNALKIYCSTTLDIAYSLVRTILGGVIKQFCRYLLIDPLGSCNRQLKI